MGDERVPRAHLATRLLPWSTGVLGAGVSISFHSAPGLAAWLGFSYAMILGAALVARAGLRPRHEPPSAARVAGLWGALLGPFALAGMLGLGAWAGGSSWILVGLLLLLFGLPLVMLVTGALSWAGASLVSRARLQPELRTRAGLWVPAAIIVLVLGLPTALLLKGLGLEVRRAAGASPATRPEMLARLALDDDVATQVARNAATPAASLRKLAASTRDEVREGVASNRSTPPDVLATLATDAVQRVRGAAERTLQQQRPINSPPVGRPAPAAEPR